MKFGFTVAKLVKEGKVVNIALMGDYSEHTDESSWQVDDDVLYFNHKTKKFRLEQFAFSEEEGDWIEGETLGHKEAIQVALDNNIIYKVKE